ncbi:hypothetical protein NPIL_309151 [Nephila pilipes]|uniref:Uncharacterized protein n=1 Tax=Nephila pilipes TaxID=299642 RepID=A0A8X6NA04_NEPPI|nr:hypothetical protein NPIL_309151 [Nephila pilipes]
MCDKCFISSEIAALITSFSMCIPHGRCHRTCKNKETPCRGLDLQDHVNSHASYVDVGVEEWRRDNHSHSVSGASRELLFSPHVDKDKQKLLACC